MALLPLPPQVVSRIRSGVSLVSPSQCLAELIFNSIDAGATNIVAHLDLSCHKMQVKDNGAGMTPDHLKFVGERYCTSKCHSVNDLSDLQSYGYRGEALASLREISGMMEIISKTSSCVETYCKLFVQENNIKSHFFLSHNSTPFLPRPSLQRNTIWTKLKSRALFQKGDDGLSNTAVPCMRLTNLTSDNAGTNVSDLFQNWKNPVFQRQDFKEITNISLKQIAKREVKIYNLMQPHNLSKNELDFAKVIGQVDSKFIACLVPKCEKDTKADDFIMLFDQHAVHERIRLEQLIQDLYENGNAIQKIKSSLLESTVSIKLRPEELRIIKAYNNELNKLGFTLQINDQNSATVSSVPSCLLEKESNDWKKGKNIVIETILKEWVQMLQETGVATSLPKTLLSILNSQACHGAIKFGDHLRKTECSKLIAMLTSCKLPFQCAHGRPSLVPLVDLSSFRQSETKVERPQLWKLAKR